MVKKYHGVIIPMITPVSDDGKIDHAAVRRIISHLVENGVIPFIFGTTGESASIPKQYKTEMTKTVVDALKGRELLYAGIAENCVQLSVELAKEYFDMGVDVFVAHLPTYYQLTPDDMLRYYENLADQVPGPIIIYNISITTHMSIPLETVEKLSKHPNIVGMKDSERDVERLEKSVQMFGDREDFSLFSGWGNQVMNSQLLGWDGVVPSTGNIIPKTFYDLRQAVLNKDLDTAKQLQEFTENVSKVYQKGRILSQSLPALKVMMQQLGLCTANVFPPLIELSDLEAEEIKVNMIKLGLINER